LIIAYVFNCAGLDANDEECRGGAIESMLEKENLKGARSALKALYNHTGGRDSKPSHDDLDKLETEYTGLYRRGNPPGELGFTL
jgi:hypothetical protein